MSQEEFFAPSMIDEALALLAYHSELEILAGGTDLWPRWSAEGNKPKCVLSLHRLREMRHIELDIESGRSSLRIGALCTHSDLVRSILVQKHAPALAKAAATVGAVQVQNRGTIGGNLANASPAGDLAPPLMAARAKVELRSKRGVRLISLDRFFVDYRTIDRQSDELLSALLVPSLPDGAFEQFIKVGTRRAQAISKVSGACRLELSEDGSIGSIGLVFASIGPIPIRLTDLEQELQGKQLSAETAQEAEQKARMMIAPIDDLRSTADYRRHIVGQLVSQWLRYCPQCRLADHSSSKQYSSDQH
jgi:CO/xanthine dehydrogenase FAD-binding subunit